MAALGAIPAQAQDDSLRPPGAVLQPAPPAVLPAVPPPAAVPAAPAAPGAEPEPAAPDQTLPQAVEIPLDPALRISWEAKNRFRLFRRETDFRRHLAADRGDGVLAAEDRLQVASDGRGWARTMFDHLCVDRGGAIAETCDRDGDKENYLAPVDHKIGVVLTGPALDGASCAWTFADNAGPPQAVTVPCAEQVRLRVRYGYTTVALVDVSAPGQPARRARTEIAVEDLLIAGLGDSIAAGEGNPDRPVQLDDNGFCFRRFINGNTSEFYRPGRAGYRGNRTCSGAPGEASLTDWAKYGAHWLSAACHRSLYGYQIRAALQLAVENPHIAVTYLPLACTGATIAHGLFGDQVSRECPPNVAKCRGAVPGQIGQLTALLARARKTLPERKLDLMLLTIGANDTLFSSLVADVIVDTSTERTLFRLGGVLASVDDARAILDRKLPGDFAKLREALKPLTGGDLSRVVYVTYGHPALAPNGAPCPGGRDGFDVHPAFAVDQARLNAVSSFVADQFLPRIRALARCEGGTICKNREADAMTFVDAHQPAFVQHGFCARAETDPPFDRQCISPGGDTFNSDPARGAEDPMACGAAASEYRPYAARARWIRTADDSYFTAMTYPGGLTGAMQPGDIHDATWGVLSAVYGGAIHPTAQGHAAMADAALPAMRALLGLAPPAAYTSAPLPAPDANSPQ